MNPGLLCIIDKDAGFIQVLDKRAGATGWKRRVFSVAPRVEELISMKADALVFDLDAIGPSGWEFLESVCSSMPDLGVIVCTIDSSTRQRIRGLNLGADDWVAKPCHPEEVIARVEAVVRRHRRGLIDKSVGPLVVGEVEVRPDQYQAFVGGRSAELTKREFELVDLLAKAGGRVIEREEIYRRVWGYQMAHGDRSVDVYVRKVRKKLSRVSPGWDYVHTHFGIGYRLKAMPADESELETIDKEKSVTSKTVASPYKEIKVNSTAGNGKS